MASSVSISCPPPFLNVADFPYTGGQEANRFCAPIDQNTTCCLPCPATNWVYPDNFKTVAMAANWLGLGSFVCCIFLLISFLVLPVRKTSRHYLTVCLIAAVGCMTFAFVISQGANPQQCHDAITPNDMRSDLACAFSGSFVVFGGMACAVWIFIRSLSLHLQICWQIVPGKRFFWAALIGGWGAPSVLLAVSLALSGVSYRFGPICHLNHDYSIGSFWGPLLGFTGLATACQFATLAYCIRVYLRSLLDTAPSATSSTAASGTLPSVNSSFNGMSAKAAYRRVRKVIALQWRGVMVVIILIVTATFFSAVFLKLDNASVSTQRDPSLVLPWATCLFLTGGNKDLCLPKVSGIILGEPSVATCLYLLAFTGVWCVLFLGRISMAGAWWDLIRHLFRSDSDNWVSADARRLSDPRNYEMLSAPPQQYYMAKGPSGLVATASIVHTEKSMPSPHIAPRYHGHKNVMRDFSPSSRDPYLKEDTASTIERTLSKTSLQARPTRSASSNTARVTFSRETPTPIQPTSFSPRSPSSINDYYTPRSYGSPAAAPARQHYVSSSRADSRTDVDRSGAINTRTRTPSAGGRDWYGSGNQGSRPPTHDGEQRSLGSGSLREWDPQSTFAQSTRVQYNSRHIEKDFF